LWIAVLGLVALPVPGHASDESDVLRARAVRRIQAGDCEAALPLLERALAADAQEARAGLLAGRCLINLGRRAEAETVLLDTARRAPALEGVQLQLAVARYHRDDLTGARAALEAARPQSAGDAQFELYDALVLLAEGRREDALGAFGRARAADAARVEPVASYYEGLAASREGERRRARAALERVAARDPDGPWGKQARQQLDQMGRGLQADGWLAATVGAEWDSNDALRGEDVALPDDADLQPEIRSERDTRLVWRANAGIEALRTLEWSGGAMLTYSGAANSSLDQFNTHYPIGSLWIDRHLSERTTAHMQYDAGYAWVHRDPWLTSHNLGPALHHDWGNGQRSRLFGRVYWWDFHWDRSEFGDSLVQEKQRDRDGHGVSLGAEHLVPVEALASTLSAGVAATRYAARGKEYSYRGLEAWIGARTRLPWQLALATRASIGYRPYNHSTTFADPEDAVLEGKTRRDHVRQIEIGLERPITKTTSAALRWRFLDNASNVDVFDYDRSIVGAYLSFRID
jgi:hypothetical protein